MLVKACFAVVMVTVLMAAVVKGLVRQVGRLG